MAFFNDLIDSIERTPPAQAVRTRHLGATDAVLKYAPRRLRPEPGDAAQAQAEADYWRRRAFKAETQLRALGTRLQTLAARSR